MVSLWAMTVQNHKKECIRPPTKCLVNVICILIDLLLFAHFAWAGSYINIENT